MKENNNSIDNSLEVTSNEVTSKIVLGSDFGVYQIKSMVDDKLYIGSTTRSFTTRWSQWRANLKRGKANNYIQNAWNKYGSENFEFSVVEVVKIKEDVKDREQYYIDLYDVCDREKGFNFQKNANLNSLGYKFTKEQLENKTVWNKGKKGEYKLGPCPEERKKRISEKQIGKFVSEETRAKISEAGKGRIGPNLGKKMKEESRLKMIASKTGNCGGSNHPLFGKKHSEESKKKMSESHKDTSGINNPFYGKTHSEETREKLRLANKGNTPHTRPFILIDPNGKTYTGTNLNQFCRDHNLTPSSMCLVRNEKQESHRGWKFSSTC